MTCTYPSLVPVIVSMGFPLQKTGDTCVGNIENEDGMVLNKSPYTPEAGLPRLPTSSCTSQKWPRSKRDFCSSHLSYVFYENDEHEASPVPQKLAQGRHRGGQGALQIYIKHGISFFQVVSSNERPEHKGVHILNHVRIFPCVAHVCSLFPLVSLNSFTLFDGQRTVIVFSLVFG